MLTLAAAASASRFFRTSSSTLNGVDAGFFAPHPCFFFFVSGGGAGGSSSGGGGGAGCSGGGGGAAESSGGGGGGAGGCSEGAGGGIEDEVSADPFDTMPSIMIRDTEWLKWVRSRPRIEQGSSRISPGYWASQVRSHVHICQMVRPYWKLGQYFNSEIQKKGIGLKHAVFSFLTTPNAISSSMPYPVQCEFFVWKQTGSLGD